MHSKKPIAALRRCENALETLTLDVRNLPAKIPRVGFLAPQGRSLPLLERIPASLADLGYVDGRNVVIEPRFAEGQYKRFPELIAELVRLKVDVLTVTGAVTARAAKKAVADIPLIFTVVVNPVADNLVPSLERPGGNITGVTSFDPQQATKQLELLKEVIPGLQRVAILRDQGVRAPSYPAHQRVWLTDRDFNYGFQTRYRSPETLAPTKRICPAPKSRHRCPIYRRRGVGTTSCLTVIN
jgi:ABC transporter substrate binding protein